MRKNEFTDRPIVGENDDLDLNEALVLQRDGDNDHAIVRTNVPHLVAHHSPSGFEFGYGGSGPADLALNVCQWYLNYKGYKGAIMKCWDGNCWSLSWVLHQDFKREFIANAPHDGVVIPFAMIDAWFQKRITDDLRLIYSDELAEYL